jgi:hypothetical protein
MRLHNTTRPACLLSLVLGPKWLNGPAPFARGGMEGGGAMSLWGQGATRTSLPTKAVAAAQRAYSA